MKKIVILVLGVVLALTLLGGCGATGKTQGAASGTGTVTVTDLLGRQVKVKASVERVVAIGPGALRLYTYVNGTNKVVGIEKFDQGSPMGKPYLLANPSLASLPMIGQGGPNTAPDPEKLLSAKPDVIFNTLVTDKSAVEELQAKTGVPVVALSYGQSAVFDPESYASLKLVGAVMKQEKRAQEVVDYMENLRIDLDKRTKAIPETAKPSAYVGALGSRGTHGIVSTQGNYALFKAINAKNVADVTGKTGALMIDKEKLLVWDPEKIFIDVYGLDLVKQDYQKNPEYYRKLRAFQKGDVYLQMPYNAYTTNIDTALVNAYYQGKVLYPTVFDDIKPAQKADEIYQFLLGKPLYAQMAKDYGPFEKLKLP